jgi:GDP-L-fucose synthase
MSKRERAVTSVLITGATGLVGKALVDELRASPGYSIVGLESARVDLRDNKTTQDYIIAYKPDIVFHLAARVGGLGGNLAQPGTFFYENILINTNVVEGSRNAGVKKIIAMGSSACYSDAVDLPMREECIWDGPPHNSEAAYAHSKRSLLAQLEAYKSQYGIDYAFCIATNMYGQYDKFDENYGHVLPSLISKFHRARHAGGVVSIWGTGTPKRDFLYAKDAARYLRVIAEKFSGSINLASGSVVTIKDLVKKVEHASGFSGSIEWDGTKPNGQELRGYDISKLNSLGLEPAYSLSEGISETYAWYDAHAKTARR